MDLRTGEARGLNRRPGFAHYGVDRLLRGRVGARSITYSAVLCSVLGNPPWQEYDYTYRGHDKDCDEQARD